MNLTCKTGLFLFKDSVIRLATGALNHTDFGCMGLKGEIGTGLVRRVSIYECKESKRGIACSYRNEEKG